MHRKNDYLTVINIYFILSKIWKNELDAWRKYRTYSLKQIRSMVGLSSLRFSWVLCKKCLCYTLPPVWAWIYFHFFFPMAAPKLPYKYEFMNQTENIFHTFSQVPSEINRAMPVSQGGILLCNQQLKDITLDKWENQAWSIMFPKKLLCLSSYT